MNPEPVVLGVEDTGKALLATPPSRSASGTGVEEGAGEAEEAGVEETVGPRVLEDMEEAGVEDMLAARVRLGRKGESD